MLFLYRKHLFVKTETFNINIKTMAKIVTLGEIMLRLSSPGQKRFVQSEFFDVVTAVARLTLLLAVLTMATTHTLCQSFQSMRLDNAQ